MIKAILVDDEYKGLEILRLMLKKHCPEIEVVGCAEEIATAINLINEKQPELVFLDIEMSGETGFDLLEQVRPYHFHVIFVTAYSEYAVRAFRYSVSDYLLKPVVTGELVEAVSKVKDSIKEERNGSPFSSNGHDINRGTLKIPVHDRSVFVKIIEIIRIEADGAYTRIFLTGNRQYVISYNIKVVEEHLNDNEFIRIHRSHIINLSKVTSFTENYHDAVMCDGSIINISRRSKTNFLTMMAKKRKIDFQDN